jgi:hypothetical protein
MKRNWDTIRRILLAVEDADKSLSVYEIEDAINDKNRSTGYHVRLLINAGFLSFHCHEEFYWITGMTMAGHDLLDKLRKKNP